MFIEVLAPRSTPKGSGDFYLIQDKWNDYMFETQYQLYLSEKYTEDKEAKFIGTVKILKKGQTKSDSLQLKVGNLEPLNDDFCSLGQSLDYYQRLAELDSNLRNPLLDYLRDVIAYPDYIEQFQDEKGWIVSLMRDIKKDDDIFVLAPFVINQNYDTLPSLDLTFEFSTPQIDHPIKFDFSSPTYGFMDETLPSRMSVVIGRNGSGKSTLLSKISRIAFASAKDRNNSSLQKVGQFQPTGLGFPKILNITYSAFDSFQVPGIYQDEKEQIIKDLKHGQGRYIFCGIRDIVKELEQAMPTLNFIVDESGRRKLAPEEILNDRQSHNTLLKSIDALAKEFKDTYNIIIERGKTDLLDKTFEIIGKEPSFNEFVDGFIEFGSDEEINNYFMSKSTGHKFVLHSLINIIAHVEPRTLVLFDEPETHLHPPLLAVLMSAIRYVLNQKDAFAIIATHSPVVLQETLKKHVYIVRRVGDESKIVSPTIQTYGENIGMITSHVFSLSSEMTDFHFELDKVIKNLTSWKTVDYETIMSEVEELFDDELSMQARAYIQSKLLEIAESE